jgi:hypothetical protein
MFRQNKRPASAFLTLRTMCLDNGFPVYPEWLSDGGAPALDGSATERFVTWLRARLVAMGKLSAPGYVEPPAYIICTPELIDRKKGLVPDNIRIVPGIAPSTRGHRTPSIRQDAKRAETTRRLRAFAVAAARATSRKPETDAATADNSNNDNNASNSNNAENGAPQQNGHAANGAQADSDDEWTSEDDDTNYDDDGDESTDDDEDDGATQRMTTAHRAKSGMNVPDIVDPSVIVTLCDVDCTMTKDVATQAQDALSSRRQPLEARDAVQRARLLEIFNLLFVPAGGDE